MGSVQSANGALSEVASAFLPSQPQRCVSATPTRRQQIMPDQADSVSEASRGRRPATSGGSRSTKTRAPDLHPKTAAQTMRILKSQPSLGTQIRSRIQWEGMWLDSESIVQTDPAFSRRSIAIGSNDGTIDAEGHNILLKMATKVGTADAYENAAPQMRVRNISESTRVKMPKLGSVTASDITFGNQSVSAYLYVFACHVYNL
jgi:hypothetical protein